MASFIFSFVLISAVIYFGLAAGLIILGRPKGAPDQAKAPSFEELFFDYSGLPESQTFPARDGAGLPFRFYPIDSDQPGSGDKTLILVHGSGWHSRYLLPLARAVAASGAARVYTPDLRGHGQNPARRGDIDYIGQLTDDLADLIAFITSRHPGTKIIIGGHSSGGGLAVRLAGTEYGRAATGYLLLAPFLKYNAPTTRPGSGGWARAYTGRIIGLVMLNNIGLRWFNRLPVIDFNMPDRARDGTESLVYSFRLNTGLAPADYTKDLAVLKEPLLVVAGTADESFLAEQYQPTVSRYAKGRFALLEGASHLGLVADSRLAELVIDWLKEL